MVSCGVLVELMRVLELCYRDAYGEMVGRRLEEIDENNNNLKVRLDGKSMMEVKGNSSDPSTESDALTGQAMDTISFLHFYSQPHRKVLRWENHLKTKGGLFLYKMIDDNEILLLYMRTMI
jgi:hypothetical protein